jgi:hypothetical protein
MLRLLSIAITVFLVGRHYCPTDDEEIFLVEERPCKQQTQLPFDRKHKKHHRVHMGVAGDESPRYEAFYTKRKLPVTFPLSITSDA